MNDPTPATAGVVSLGMGPRAETECPNPTCESTEALVTHTVTGDEVHVCAKCGETWLTGAVEETIANAASTEQ